MGIRDGLLGWASRLGWGRRQETPIARPGRSHGSAIPSREWPNPTIPLIDLSGSAPALNRSRFEAIHPKLSLDLIPTPKGNPDLREALYHHNLTRWSGATKGGFLPTQGATGAFQAIANAFINRGDPVIVCDPGCPSHASILGHRGAQIRHLGVTLDHEGALSFSESELARLAPGARMLVISQPNNPDGGLWAAEALDALKGWAKRNEWLVIVDETYADFIPLALRDSGIWRTGWNERALFVGSLSKSHPAPGTRVGWVQGPEKWTQAIERVIHLQGSEVSWQAEQAALRVLAGPGVAGDFLQKMEATRALAESQLKGLGMCPSPAQAGMFLWMPTWNLAASSKNLARDWKDSCLVSVAPGERFGPLSMGHIRLNLAADHARLAEGLKRLKAWSEGEMHLDSDSWSGWSGRQAA